MEVIDQVLAQALKIYLNMVIVQKTILIIGVTSVILLSILSIWSGLRRG